jgi:hypothetical protein
LRDITHSLDGDGCVKEPKVFSNKHLSPVRPRSGPSRHGDGGRLRAPTARTARRTAGIAILALLLAASAAAADDRARAIVERAAERQGGGKLALKGAIRSFHVELDVMKADVGTADGAGTLTRTYRPPAGDRKAQFRESWEDATGVTHRGLGYDADGRYRGWTRKGRGEARPLSVKQKDTYLKLREDARQMGLLLDAFLLRNLLGEGVTLALEGKVKAGPRVEWRVKRTVEGERPIVLGIDAETHDLVRVVVPAADEGSPTRVFLFSKHREFEKVRVPGKIAIHERTEEERKAGKPWRETTVAFLDDLKLNRREHGEAFFAMPEK